MKTLALVALALVAGGCIQIRQAGAHEITVHIHQSLASIQLHTERADSPQDAVADPKQDISPTVTVPPVP